MNQSYTRPPHRRQAPHLDAAEAALIVCRRLRLRRELLAGLFLAFPQSSARAAAAHKLTADDIADPDLQACVTAGIDVADIAWRTGRGDIADGDLVVYARALARIRNDKLGDLEAAHRQGLTDWTADAFGVRPDAFGPTLAEVRNLAGLLGDITRATAGVRRAMLAVVREAEVA